MLYGRPNPTTAAVKQKEVEKEEDNERATILARALLEAALAPPDDVEDEDLIVKEEDQRSLSVGIIGAPNAGKSSLTNFMVSSTPFHL